MVSGAPREGGLAAPSVTVDSSGRYFAQAGERWFPTGWCCTAPQALRKADLEQMASWGCNTLRIWPDVNETGSLPESLPDLLDAAEVAGIRCAVTMLNLGELSDLFIDESNLKRRPNAYSGVCELPQELLTKPEALEVHCQRIDRLMEVVGERPAVWAWIVASQSDGVYQVPLPTLQSHLASVVKHVAQRESARAQAPLRAVTSFDPLPVWQDFYEADYVDMIALQCYSPAVYSPLDGVQAAWEVALATAQACRRRRPGRPVLCMEYGPILHLFLHDEPALPSDLLRRWRRNTSAAHLCAGGAGGPLLVPPIPSDATVGGAPGTLHMTDQVRRVPRTIPPVFEPEERAFRKLLREPVLQHIAPDPVEVHCPEGTLVAACGADDGAMLVWVSADSRLAERRQLLERALEDDPAVSPLLGYDAGRAVLDDVGARVWNPGSRALIGKLVYAGLADVAEQRIQEELRKVSRVLCDVEVPRGQSSLGGVSLELPNGHGPRRFRSYDLSTGEVVASGWVRSDMLLPDLAETVIAVEPSRRRQEP